MVKGGDLKSSSSYDISSYKEPLYEKPFFQYFLLLLVIAILALGIFNTLNIYQLKNFLVPTTNDVIQQPQQAQLPADFLTKLNAHPELQGLENEQPIGGQLDADSLNTLKQQFPDVYLNAKVGDFLLRYTTRLIIYDYNADVIVNAVNLG